MGWTDWDYQALFDRAALRGLKYIGMMLEGYAAALSEPRDTGRLIGSITHAMLGDQGRPRPPATNLDVVSMPTEKNVVHIGTNVDYAEYVNYGAQGRPPRRFMEGAMDQGRKPAQELFNRELQRELRSGRG